MKARFDIPFAADDAHRFLPWLIGIMVGMAALMLCLVVTINSWVVDRHGTYNNSFTVTIPGTLPDLEGKTLLVYDMLKRANNVTSVNRISEEKLRDMLVPWLGKNDLVGELPLPTMFDVTTNGKAAVIDATKLEKNLNVVAPGAEVDTHERWISAFSDFSSALQWLMTFLSVLIVGSMAVMIAFTSRASLKLHAKTVQLLHSIGAEDGYIAGQFQNEVFMLALRGALAGCLVAAAAYWGAGWYLTSLNAPQLPTLNMNTGHFALIILMPVACGMVALWAARLSVLEQLKRLP